MRARLPTHRPVPIELLFLSLSPPARPIDTQSAARDADIINESRLARSALQAALEAPAAKRMGDEAGTPP